MSRKKKELDELPLCKCTWTFLSIKQPHFFPSIFSSFWGENFLVSPGRKHSNSIYFPFSSHNQAHSKKNFLPIFSLKFFIHLLHLQTNTPIKRVYKVKRIHSLKKKSVEVKSFTVYYFKFSKNILAVK